MDWDLSMVSSASSRGEFETTVYHGVSRARAPCTIQHPTGAMPSLQHYYAVNRDWVRQDVTMDWVNSVRIIATRQMCPIAARQMLLAQVQGGQLSTAIYWRVVKCPSSNVPETFRNYEYIS